MFHVKHSPSLHVISDDAGDHGFVVALGDCPQENMAPRIPCVVRIGLAHSGSRGPKTKRLQNIIGHRSFCHRRSLPDNVPNLPFQHSIDFHRGEVCEKIVARSKIKLFAHDNVWGEFVSCAQNIVDTGRPMLILELLNTNDRELMVVVEFSDDNSC
nr:MAG TPA: hypothetical protein [Caudoviricetes sp.]